MFKLMEKLKFPIDLKNRFVVSYIYGDNSCCFFGNNEDVLWGLREHEIIIKIQEYEDGKLIVDMHLGTQWYDIHGAREDVIVELNEVIVPYFSDIAYKKKIEYREK